MKKLIIIILAVLLIIGGLGLFGFNLFKEFGGGKIIDQMIDTEIQKLEEKKAIGDTEADDEINKLFEAKKNVTPEDKKRVMSIIMEKLSTGEMVKIQEMVTDSDGVTAEDKAEIRQMIAGKLTEDDKNELKGMYKKYMK